MALAKKTLLICRAPAGFPASFANALGSGPNAGSVGEQITGCIDVWWIFDLFPSNGLMLLLPYLLTKHRVWRRCTTRLFVVASPDTDLSALKELLTTMVNAGGMRVQVEVLSVDPNEAPRFGSGTQVQTASQKLMDYGLQVNSGLPSFTLQSSTGTAAWLFGRHQPSP